MYDRMFLICILALSTASPDTGIQPEFTAPEVIQKYGYPVEAYHVVTEDGYILQMYRIPYSSKSPAASKKPVVLFHPGLGSSAREWVLYGPERALGLQLADEGYDVWLGNYRGNLYSKNHTTLSVRSRKFWDFSIHEMGVYDIPAMVDFIINKTGVERHFHIGISMGGTAPLVFAATRPEYNKNIRLIVGEGSPVFFKGASTPAFSVLAENVVNLMTSLGMNEISVPPIIWKFLNQNVCSNNITKAACAALVFATVGYDAKQFNESVMPYVILHLGQGLSSKLLRHYLQIQKSGKFQQYDYGEKLNMKKYGQPNPPEYNLKAITAPLSIMYAERDTFYGVNDMIKLCKAVSNCAEFYKVPYKSFAHFGFLYANDVKTLVNDEIIRQFKKY